MSQFERVTFVLYYLVVHTGEGEGEFTPSGRNDTHLLGDGVGLFYSLLAV